MKAFINKKFPNKRVGLFTSETIQLPENQLVLKDCEHSTTGFKQFDIIIYSPTIQAGVSFNLKHFDKFYGWFCSNGRVNAIRQMIKRVRKIRLKEYNYCLNSIGGSQVPDNRRDFERWISSNRNFTQNFEIPDFLPREVSLSGNITFPYKSIFYRLWSEQEILKAND
jgi:hypothetical protein